MRISDKTNPIEYRAIQDRYDEMTYRRCGNSGILLPAISLSLWHNFGYVDNLEKARNILRAAFDAGITHFDLANNYGPPYGSAEENFGLLYKRDFMKYRDELIISSKAGYDMWPGPYGNLGSRKYLIASCDQSLKRMGLEYVDIFYHHRPDPDTPLEETMGALDQIVRQGKALYGAPYRSSGQCPDRGIAANGQGRLAWSIPCQPSRKAVHGRFDRHLQLAAGHRRPTTYYLLPTTRRRPQTAYHVVHTTCRPPRNTHTRLPAVHHLLRAAHAMRHPPRTTC